METTKIYTFHYCDAWHSFASMSMAENYYPDTEQGRAQLLAKVEAAIEDGSIELDYEIGFLRHDISCGRVQNANSMIKYGYINVLELAA